MRSIRHCLHVGCVRGTIFGPRKSRLLRLPQNEWVNALHSRKKAAERRMFGSLPHPREKGSDRPRLKRSLNGERVPELSVRVGRRITFFRKVFYLSSSFFHSPCLFSTGRSHLSFGMRPQTIEAF